MARASGEVNAGPDLVTTVPDHVFATIVGELIGDDGRIPVALIVGEATASPAAHLSARIVAAAKARIGLATPEGAWVGGEQRLPGPDFFSRVRAPGARRHQGRRRHRRGQ